MRAALRYSTFARRVLQRALPAEPNICQCHFDGSIGSSLSCIVHQGTLYYVAQPVLAHPILRSTCIYCMLYCARSTSLCMYNYTAQSTEYRVQAPLWSVGHV